MERKKGGKVIARRIGKVWYVQELCAMECGNCFGQATGIPRLPAQS